MADYILIKKKTLTRWTVIIVLTIVTVALWKFVSPYFHRAPRMITSCSYNIMRADGKDIFYFRSIGRDSMLNGIAYHRDSIRYGVAPKRTAADLHAIVKRNLDAAIYRLRQLDSIADEMRYYLEVHNVQDEGYDMVVAHQDYIDMRISEESRIKEILENAAGSDRLEIRHISVSTIADSTAVPPVFMECEGGIWKDGIWLKRAKNGVGVAFDHSGRPVSGMWNADTIVCGRRVGLNGIYSGQFARGLYAEGHGSYTYNDGGVYEGHWRNDRRDGFGFAVSPGSIRAGEWNAGDYRGERMNYTSDRIYGIDISRYQHGKGRKYYPIHWNRLKITQLGKINSKKLSGNVDYPVSFVYIKSTEGVSIRNRYYAADYRQARRNGIICGAYHFFSTKSDAAAQAHYFLRHSFFKKGDFPPVLDVEPSHTQIEKMGGELVLFRAIRTWMGIVGRQTGVRPILYVSQTFVNRYLCKAPDIKRDYNIWIARYGEYRPDVRLVYWQLCPDGRVDGIHGDVDINVFNGYRDKFEQFLNTERIK